MLKHITLTALFGMAAAMLSPVAEASVYAPYNAQNDLSAYTTPLEEMFMVVDKINTHLESVQDTESADVAGDAIIGMIQELNTPAQTFSKLPPLPPDKQAELDEWFAQHEHVMQNMIKHVQRLQKEYFYGSSKLINATVLVGGVLGGAE